MRSPRMIYLAVAAVLVVAGFALTDYIADRSAPDLGEGVVLVPVGHQTSGPNPQSTPTPTTEPTTRPSTTPTDGATVGPGGPTKRPTEAVPVSPQPVPTAGTDDDDDSDDIDDD